MTACGQDKSQNDDNLSPEVKKLKAEFLKEIKQQYFIDRDLQIPSSLEIILISNVYGIFYTYFAYDNEMGCIYKNQASSFNSWKADYILISHKDQKNIVYQK